MNEDRLMPDSNDCVKDTVKDRVADTETENTEVINEKSCSKPPPKILCPGTPTKESIMRNFSRISGRPPIGLPQEVTPSPEKHTDGQSAGQNVGSDEAANPMDRLKWSPLCEEDRKKEEERIKRLSQMDLS